MPAIQNRSRPVPPYLQNPVYHQQPIAPIHLSAAVQLQSGASGGVPSATLKNPMGQDMEILEVKFEVSGVIDNNNIAGIPFGGSIGCELTMGNYKLTQGSVPVWCFGRAENLSGETKTDAFQLLGYNAYTWRLPRPLFVPAGGAVVPRFDHAGYVPQTLNVRIGYSARKATKAPKAICIPWVSAYRSKIFNPITAASSDSSQEQDLINNTDKPMQLQRFIGRTIFTDTNNKASESQPPSFTNQFLTMRMADSYGRPLVRTYTPFRSVFGAVTRSWELEEVGAMLDPGAYYRVFLKKAAMTMALNQDAAYAQAFVSMVGWREEAV